MRRPRRRRPSGVSPDERRTGARCARRAEPKGLGSWVVGLGARRAEPELKPVENKLINVQEIRGGQGGMDGKP